MTTDTTDQQGEVKREDDGTRKLRTRIQESAPLADRLQRSRDMIGKMCSEGRPPRMSIPVQWDDEDVYIGQALEDAAEAIEEQRRRMVELVAEFREMSVTESDDEYRHGQYAFQKCADQLEALITGETTNE